MSSLIMAIFLTCSAALVVVACWRDRRSLRAGDHPHCRRCDRDLFGLDEDVVICPDCGADLTEAGSVVIGAPRANRRAQWIKAAIAVVMLGLAVTYWRAVEWTAVIVRVSPAWVLIGHASRGGPAGGAAAEELERRVFDGWYKGDQLDAAMNALWPMRVTARQSVRGGEWLPYELFIPTPKGIHSHGFESGDPPYVVYWKLYRARVGDGQWNGAENEWQSLPPGLWPLKRSVRLPYGRTPTTVPTRVGLTFQFRLVRRRDASTVDYKRRDDPYVVEWEQEFEAPLNILPPDGEDVELVVDEQLRPKVRSTIQPSTDLLRRSPEGLRVEWSLEAIAPPIGLAVDVWLRDPASGRDVRLGDLTFNRGERVTAHSSTQVSRSLEHFLTLDRVDLILKPSKEAARRMPDTRIWGEDVVIENVPIQRAATQPGGVR